MTEKYVIQPDLDFISQIKNSGGDTLKKCFQCATCSVVCPISPDNSPFPRKEMIASSWGLKDKVICSGDIWLCHQCGDCSDLCPRGARPGDVLAAVRSIAINEYAKPKSIANAFNNPSKLPWLIGIPAIWFAVLAFITTTAGDTMTKIFNSLFGGLIHWSHSSHGEAEHVIAHSDFFSTWFVDITFIPLSIFVLIIFVSSLKKFLNDIHKNAVEEGKTDKEQIDLKGFLQSLKKVVVTVLKHEKFNQCETNKSRATPHMMVLFSFIGLAVVTGIFFLALYVFQIPGPYSQFNPVKWLANISGIALIIGSSMMIKNRFDNKENQVTTYKDWYVLGVVFSLGATGLLAEITRLGGLTGTTYFFYFLHLIAIFNLFLCLPFSKMAHIVYRFVAMTYAEYSNRK